MSAHYPLFLPFLLGAKRHFSIPLVRYEVMILPSPHLSLFPFSFPFHPRRLTQFSHKSGKTQKLNRASLEKEEEEREWGRPPNKRETRLYSARGLIIPPFLLLLYTSWILLDFVSCPGLGAKVGGIPTRMDRIQN